MARPRSIPMAPLLALALACACCLGEASATVTAAEPSGEDSSATSKATGLARSSRAVGDFAGSISRVGTNTVQFASPANYQFIVVTVSTKFEPSDGSHTATATFGVDVQGQRVDTFSHSVAVNKGGSSGHYWGYQSYAVSQRMTVFGVFQGNSVRVSLLSANLHANSDIRVELTN